MKLKTTFKSIRYRGAWLGAAWLALTVLAHKADAGNHHVESPDHRCVGCIDGSCGAPISPFGHYRGTWRRFPGSADTRFEQLERTQSSAGEPIVPPPMEELNSRERSRSDRPLEPEEMIDLGQIAPAIPGATDSNNPFNNTVNDADLPQPGAGGGMGDANDMGGANNIGGADNGLGGMFEQPDPILPNVGGDSPPPFQNDPAPAPGFGVPDGTQEPDPALDLFNSLDPKRSPTRSKLAANRSIKSRGVNLLKQVELDTVSLLPQPVTGPPLADANHSDPLADLIVDPSIGLASYVSEADQTKALPQTTVLPQPSVLPQPTDMASLNLASLNLASNSMADANGVESNSANALPLGAPNPLRRSPNLRRSLASKRVKASNGKTAHRKPAELKPASLPASESPASATMATLVPHDAPKLTATTEPSSKLSTRKVRLRDNPLRR